jgi:hypothetical protein
MVKPVNHKNSFHRASEQDDRVIDEIAFHASILALHAAVDSACQPAGGTQTSESAEIFAMRPAAMTHTTETHAAGQRDCNQGSLQRLARQAAPDRAGVHSGGGLAALYASLASENGTGSPSRPNRPPIQAQSPLDANTRYE